jgi:hypothetical protein
MKTDVALHKMTRLDYWTVLSLAFFWPGGQIEQACGEILKLLMLKPLPDSRLDFLLEDSGMFVRSVLPLLFLSLIVYCPSVVGGEAVAQLAGGEEVVERFSIRKDSGSILLPVAIKGKRYRLSLDTGAYCTVYDRPLWNLLGKPKALQKIGSEHENFTVRFFDPPDARLGKLTLPKDSPVMGADMKELREEFGEDYHGILGMDFLKRHVFRMDFDRGEIVFLRKIGPDPGQRLAVTLRHDLPYVRINLPGLKEPEEFILDTGHGRGGGGDGGILRKATFEALIKSRKLIPCGNFRSVGLAGRQMSRYGRLDALPFAGNTHKNLMFDDSREYSFLGLDVLSRYVVTFDFPHQAIYLKKGREFDKPYRYDRSGLYVRRVKGQTVVASVADGSAAAKAGILPGDVLLQIDKEQINGMTLFTLRDRLRDEGKKIVLTVRREAKQFDVPVALSSGR